MPKRKFVPQLINNKTIQFHPQAKDIERRYLEAADERAVENAELQEMVNADLSGSLDILPRPFTYFLPTGNDQFDEWIDSITPSKDERHEIKGGGFPVGKISVIAARAGLGKTQFMYSLAKNAPFKTLYVDTEGGVNKADGKSNVYVYNSPILEQVWKVVLGAVDKGEFQLIVIDSISALKTLADMAKEDGEMPQMGERAKVLGSFLTKLSSKLLERDVAVVLISQQRENIGGYGAQKVIPGGQIMNYTPSLILELLSNKADIIRDKDTKAKIGEKVKVNIIKNRYGQDAATFDFKLFFNQIASSPQKTSSRGDLESS